MSNETKWGELEEKIAGVLNIFTANLRVQYVLSTEPAGAIPIMLMSQADLDELHERLIPLVVPPRNANGSVSKRKMKEVTVKVTDKSDDANSSGGNGKVRYKFIFYDKVPNYHSRRNVTKAENGLIRLLIQLLSSTKKGSLCVRLSGVTGSVKHTPSETGLCHAGGMVTRLSATLSQKMTSTYGQNYKYVLQNIPLCCVF